MDRQAWLAERRAAVVADYDAEAPTYDMNLYPAGTQEMWAARLLGMIPAGSTVLDAPCGTGRYFPLIAGAGMRVIGVDQSAGMLAQARARNLASILELKSLQDLSYAAEFDATVTIDAMENVPPDDWPTVLANLRRAVRPGGVLYLTVEEASDQRIGHAFEALTARGLPAVRGEIIEGDVAGYHYYPGRDRVMGWFEAAGLDVIDEDYSAEEDWGYRHFLLRAPQ
ncbi:MAG TPA: methyltransferase domain-containing protein [Streptosporangiaceae bacterium]